jgi:2-keto-4-pentenoate hydratase/2-oxohepta-3-ene-1,7-dioic acid hydratase in catechol pathway
MKILNFKVGDEIRLGIKSEEGIIDVMKAAEEYSLEVPATLLQAIAGGEKALAQLDRLIEKEVQTIPEEKVSYAPSIINPEKIICVGLNYASHGAECKIDLPTSPVLFSKFNNALAAHNQIISLPKTAEKFDYEAELVIVIGKEAVNVSKEDALSYVFGYTVGNDLSARDLQFRTGQWLLGKTCDNFAPIGPYLVTADEINPSNLEISCKVNGVIKQSANTCDMIFDCSTIISYLSQYMTLRPGDIIFSGTPSGVVLGYPEGEQQWLKAGDEVVVSIEKIGSLVNILK